MMKNKNSFREVGIKLGELWKGDEMMSETLSFASYARCLKDAMKEQYNTLSDI